MSRAFPSALLLLLLALATPRALAAPPPDEPPPIPVTAPDRARLVALNTSLPEHGLVPVPAPATDAPDGRWVTFAVRLGRRIAPKRSRDHLVAARPLSDAVGALLPRHRRYRALQAWLERLRVALRDGPPTLPRTRYELRVGVTAPEVAVLRDRLDLEGYGDPSVRGRLRQYFDDGLKRALWRWQKAAKVPVTVVVDEHTRQALNRGLETAVARVGLALARWRELDLVDDTGRQVLVHLNRYQLVAERDGRAELAMKVIVGRTNPDDATPTLSSALTEVVANPLWRVPRRIVDATLRPDAGDDPDVLRAKGFQVSLRDDGSWRVVQPPGPDNPLGRLVLRMPRTAAIYLHDTPQRELFGKRGRARSHGCVRVEQAEALARWLLDDAGDAALTEALAQPYTRSLAVASPPGAHLVYQTLTVDDAGRLERHRDLYGLDAAPLAAFDVAGLLRHPPPLRAAADPTADETPGPAPAETADAYGLDVPVQPLDDAPTFSLARFEGELLIVTFLASWCDNCKLLAPELGRAVAKLAEDGVAVKVIGVALEEGPQAASLMRRYVARNTPPYPVVLASPPMLRGETTLGLTERLPTTWVVGRTGVPLYRYVGRDIAARLIDDLTRYLAAEKRLKAKTGPDGS